MSSNQRTLFIQVLIAPLCIILFGLLYRLAPHPYNITPVIAIALFSGALFRDYRIGICTPLIMMLISDFMLGFHSTIPFTYLAIILSVGIGIWLRTRLKLMNIIGTTFLASVTFYLITNFGVWLLSPMYPPSFTGLVQAYVAGIPFFQHSLLGNFFFVAIFFGGYKMVMSDRFLKIPN